MASDTPAPDIIARLLAPYILPPGEHSDLNPAKLEHQLRAFEISYKETGNPLWAWRAIRFCTAASVAAPGWVMEYLSRVADKLWNLSHEPPADVDRAIATAVEMKLTGAGSVFTRFDDGRDLVLAAKMHWYIKDGQTETDAKFLVAKDERVGEATALRAWHKHRALFMSTDPDAA